MKTILLATAVTLLSLVAQSQTLTKEQSEKLANEIYADYTKSRSEELKAIFEKKSISINGKTMKFTAICFNKDNKVDNGEPNCLFISLHGGGSGPSKMNDQQYENQKRLYNLPRGIYIAPRAPYDDWDMWFKPDLDAFYETLIEMAILYLNVDPNQVYLMGYSAGGDGVWRMAPRMCDRWAAASMMAGHPGDVSMLNLINTPFMIWCGAEDAAYNRNLECAKYGKIMDSLSTENQGKYIHKTSIVEGKGHWMDRVDTTAVSWMLNYKRNPYPKELVHRQEEVTHEYSYWLQMPKDELQKGKIVRMEVVGNEINISECDYTNITLWLNDNIADLDKDITVKYNGKILFSGKVPRSEENLRQSLKARKDVNFMFPAKIDIAL
ncbi:MAG: alpha/beta hydrolase, partial [Bacteroidales bacterium]|nr:alpha/beta hydrolase [Bacteroidales bacterium]